MLFQPGHDLDEIAGHVALDGSKVRANASKHKGMSYKWMKKNAVKLHIKCLYLSQLIKYRFKKMLSRGFNLKD